jgi:hypothetical protein
MRQDAHAVGNAQQAVQGSGVQNNYYGAGARQAESAVSITPPFGRRNARRPVRGRDEMLDQLAGAVGEVSVIHGLGGCGKTTLALEVAYRVRQRGTEVWWVSAVESDGLVAGMRTVGRRLGLTDAELDHADVADLIWARLAARPEPWLLVLDNADDPRILAGPGSWTGEGLGWLRPVESGPVELGQAGSAVGQVLVTSRDGAEGSWGSWCIRHRLPVLPVGDAARVLSDRAGSAAGTDDEARALAERLGGLPLALRIAGSYLAESAAVPAAFAEPGQIRTYSEYQDGLDAGELDKVFRAPGTDEPSQDEARRLIGRTWDLTFAVLESRQLPEARRLLRLLACLADAPIPYELVLHPATMAESALFDGLTGARLWQVLQALDSFGLIELDATANAAIPVAQVHPLVRDTSAPRRDLAETDRAAYLDLAARLLARAAAGNMTSVRQDPRTWPAWFQLGPHVVHVFNVIVAERPDAVSAGLADAALFTYQMAMLGDDAGAEAEYREVLAARLRVLGPEHPDTKGIAKRLADLERRKQG